MARARTSGRRMTESRANARIAKALTGAQRRSVKSLPKDERPLYMFTTRQRRAMLDEPNAVVVFGERLNRRAQAAEAFGGVAIGKGGAARFSTRMAYGAGPGLTWDSDVRKMLRLVQARCASHFRNSMIEQMQPDYRRALPNPTRGDKNGLWGIETGDYANAFRLSPVFGSSVKAHCNVRTPSDNAKNSSFSSQAYRQGVELVSSRGQAAKVIAAAFDDWMRACFGDGVQTPKTLDTRGAYRIDQALRVLKF